LAETVSYLALERNFFNNDAGQYFFPEIFAKNILCHLFCQASKIFFRLFFQSAENNFQIFSYP